MVRPFTHTHTHTHTTSTHTHTNTDTHKHRTTKPQNHRTTHTTHKHNNTDTTPPTIHTNSLNNLQLLARLFLLWEVNELNKTKIVPALCRILGWFLSQKSFGDFCDSAKCKFEKLVE